MRPYPDYVVANDQLLVGINIDYPLDAPWYSIGAALQRRNLLLETFNPAHSGPGDVAYGPASFTVGALRDFAHINDVAAAVAQALQELGASVSNQAATILLYANADITQQESQQFTTAASDPRIFAPPHDFLSDAWKGISDAVQPSTWSWTTVAVGAVAVALLIEMLTKSRR